MNKEYVIIYTSAVGFKKVYRVTASSEKEAEDILRSKNKNIEINDIREANDKEYIISYLDSTGFSKFAKVSASSEAEAVIKFKRNSRYRHIENITSIYCDNKCLYMRQRDGEYKLRIGENESMKRTESYDDDYKPLPKGYYTLGDGHIHKIPTTGYSKWYRRGSRRFRYDNANKELVAYGSKYDENGNKVPGTQEIDRIGLSFYNWIDNPDYWVDQYNDDIDAIASDFLIFKNSSGV